MPEPGPVAYLAKAVLAAFRGRNGLYLLLAYILFRKFRTTVLSLRTRAEETWREYFGRTVLLLPPAQKQFSKEIMKQVVPMRERARKIFSEFGFLHTKIPDEGLPMTELKRLVDLMAAVPQRHCEKVHMSGGIYSFSYWEEGGAGKQGEEKGDESANKLFDAPAAPKSAEHYDMLARKLKEIYTYSFEKSYLWNSLHGTEFGVGDFLSYQCVRMVADLYGGKPDEVMGFVTSGGTESIMTAVRAYRDWGIANRGLSLGEGVILAGESVHAAFMKGGIAYDVQVELLPMDEFDQFDLKAVRRACKRLGHRLIAIVGSTPSYPLGTIDDISALAKIAQEFGVGMHVDSCLGGFIVNFLDTVDPHFLRIPGVTSLSCDTHKNGWAPKGSSVCVMKEIPDRTFGSVNLGFFSVYSIPGWTGGVYGTPNNAGSQHCTNALHAYLAMLAVGKLGYHTLANDVLRTSRAMAEVIAEIPEFRVLHSGSGKPKANVIAWELAPAFKKRWGGGAIYALAHEMASRGITLSALNGQRVHYCVTSRSAGDPTFVAKFKATLIEAIAATRVIAEEVVQGNGSFPGDAGIYGTLNAAMEPSVASGGLGKYIENYLFGMRGAQDSVKAYFYGIMDPYITRQFGQKS